MIIDKILMLIMIATKATIKTIIIALDKYINKNKHKSSIKNKKKSGELHDLRFLLMQTWMTNVKKHKIKA